MLMTELSDLFQDFPVINFDSKKRCIINLISRRYPNNQALLSLLNRLYKSDTIVHPSDYPLSDDFIEKINAETNEVKLELLIKERLEEQHRELTKDYLHKVNQIKEQYMIFENYWENYLRGSVNTTDKLGENIDTDEIYKLIKELKGKINSI
ncbi:hypothetical protein [Fictibacillus sp. 26RED30]|uniref:hypothetical protein n=1 Tax=Fictibacillus sp. 26RED30 TaxID=2745877 RepID=UPI0018CEB00B|nr:hypothetical protein [Fictibacillus sp. 26RED30]MBH0162078.1 hypothetical protein [Fictibacillus sp. 26RED30]